MVNRDTTTFSSEIGGTQRVDMGEAVDFDTRGVMLVDTDPPKHTRYRRLVNKGFTPRMINLLEQHLRYRAELIVDDVIEQGHCEFVTDLAAELPLQAIAEIMGVPQEDRRLMFEWSNTMIGAQDPEYQNPDDPDAPQRAAAEVFAYSNALGAARREDPRDDIVTTLINAEIEGEQLSELEFDMFMLLLVVAGNETTRNATVRGHGRAAGQPRPVRQAAVPGRRHRLRVHRHRRGAAVGHARCCTSGAPPAWTRWCGARRSRPSDKLLIWHISANRDEEVFTDPFTFDIERTPNEHVAFGGGGAHFCLGANLAKLELEIIFAEIFSRMPDMQAAGPAEPLRSNFIGGVKHLPVTFSPGPRKHPVPS